MLIFKKTKMFLIYLPVLDTYCAIKAKDESEAVYKLCYNFRKREDLIDCYMIIKNFRLIV